MTPVPLRNVRRGMCLFVMNDMVQLTPLVSVFARAVDVAGAGGSVTVFIWNGRLLTMPSTMDEKRPLSATTSRAIWRTSGMSRLDAAAKRIGQQLLEATVTNWLE